VGFIQVSVTETGKVRVVSISEIGQGSRMMKVKNRANMESADGEIHVHREEKNDKEKRTARAKGAYASEQQTESLYIKHGKVSILSLRNVHRFVRNAGRGQLSSK